jgi:hypothetical protein
MAGLGVGRGFLNHGEHGKHGGKAVRTAGEVGASTKPVLRHALDGESASFSVSSVLSVANKKKQF